MPRHTSYYGLNNRSVGGFCPHRRPENRQVPPSDMAGDAARGTGGIADGTNLSG